MLWKVIAIIVEQRLADFIEFHDVLHEFRSQRDTGKATLKAKILQEITGMWQEVLYEIFVDLHGTSDVLDMGSALEIL